jgi:cytochrome b subunit of formate dehydrogenase
MIARASLPVPLCTALLSILFGAAGGGLRAADTSASQCASCHEPTQKLANSAHAGLPCETCHDNHENYPHPANVAKPLCTTCHIDQAGDYAGGVHGQARKNGNEGAPDCSMCHGAAHELLPPKSQAFRTAVPDTCGMCHPEVADQFRKSVHGRALARGLTDAPLCTDCHGEHRILKHTNEDSRVNTVHIRETCSECHDDVRLTRKFGMPSDRLLTFDSSFHGLAAKSGSQTVANCASCHGVHNILASSDPNSTINPKNLPKTCGRCHPGAGTRFAISQVHVVKGVKEPLPLRWVRQLYLVLIPVTLGLMLVHNAGDWIRKLIRLRFRDRRPLPRGPGTDRTRSGTAHEMRLFPFERIQHAVLAISFIVLVATGFALKYSDQWWARPVLVMEGARSVRSLIHRIAAAVFIAAAIAHVISLIVNRRLREHWKAMIPRTRDAREAASNFAYNLGLGSEAPPCSPHNYIGKAEYWALVWGTLVMASTGLLLWANNLALKLFPKIVLDVATSIHFYEAVLAACAIAIWHFYAVIFDPEVYPLDTSFLTGYPPGRREASGEQEPHETPVAGD